MASQKQPIFAGFASNISDRRIFDADLVKQDLLNHFHTRRGERVMDPEYGSIIWDLLFELKTEMVTSEIERDAIRIIESEPRVRMNSVEVIEQEHGYTVLCSLYFNGLDKVEELKVNFNKKINETTRSETL